MTVSDFEHQDKPYEFHPVRRYIARILDYAIVRILLRFLLIVVFRVRPFTDLLSNVIAYGSLFLSIPLQAWFLHKFATTPGKWLMGIRIVAVDGRHLTFDNAMIREAKALCFGHGFGIPIICLICNVRSYKLYSDRRCLPQDESIEHQYEDLKKAILAGVCAVLVVMSVVCGIESVKPRHRGDLTIEEFAENYNFYCYVVNDSRNLAAAKDPMGPDGKWNAGKLDDERNTVIISTAKGQNVDYVYALEGEYLRAISYTNEWTEIQYWSMPDHLIIASLTVILSQDGISYQDASAILTDLDKEMKNNQGEITRENITIRWNIETEGCIGSDGVYIGKDGTEGTSIKLHYEIIIN